MRQLSYFDNLWYFIRKKEPFSDFMKFEGVVVYNLSPDLFGRRVAFASKRFYELDINKIRNKL